MVFVKHDILAAFNDANILKHAKLGITRLCG